MSEPLFSHMGRATQGKKVFKSIRTDIPAIQNLLDIEHRTGGQPWLEALDTELTKQGRKVTIYDSSTVFTRLFGRGTLGETAGMFGIPGGSSQVRIHMKEPIHDPYSKSLEGRNPYVQGLVDTLRHELGGHVAENITPGHSLFSQGANEQTAQGLVGESDAMTPRVSEVQRHLGIMPRYMSGQQEY